MCSRDIEPNRLVVAQEAAETFIRNQPSGTRVGIVAFSGFAELIVPPTTDKDALLEAVGGLTTGRRTAIGSAILRSVDALSEVNADVAPINAFVIPARTRGAEPPDIRLQPDIVVLLTDGASNSGALPLDRRPGRRGTGRSASTRSASARSSVRDSDARRSSLD